MYFHELKPECTKSDIKSHLSLSNLKTFYSTVHKLMTTPDHKQAIKVTFTDYPKHNSEEELLMNSLSFLCLVCC